MLRNEKGSYCIKRILLVLFFSLSVFLVSGCWDRIEVNDMAIVTATAIDKGEDQQIELSLQIFIPKTQSSGGGNQGGGGQGGQEITLVVSGKGVNIADALSKIQSELPRKIFWGQCRIFIFGEKLARDGIRGHLDFLLRHPQPRERAYVFVSEGQAKDILELQTKLERYSAEALRKEVNLGTGLPVTIQKLEEMLNSKAQAAAFPLLKISREQSKTRSYEFAELVGTGLFKKDKMVGKISERETRGLLWLRNEMKEYTITVSPKDMGGEISIYLESVNVDIIPKIVNGEWEIIVKILTEGAAVQSTSDFDLTKEKSMQVIEEAYQEAIKKRVELVIEKAQQIRADIVGFANEFHRKYPKEWQQVEQSWDELFPEVKVNIDVKAHIRRQGYINSIDGIEKGKRKDENK